MARRTRRPNSVWFALGFALLAGTGVAVVQAATGIIIVEGAQLDWYRVHAHDPVERDTAVADLAIGLFIGIFIAVGINGVSAWDMAKRGWLRGDPATPGNLPEARLWSGHVFMLTILSAVVAAIVGAGTAFLVALQGGTESISGRDFFLIKVALGGVLGFGATYVAVRNIAANASAGKLIAESPKGNSLAQLSLAASRHAWATLGVVLLVTAGLGAGMLELETNVEVTDVLPRGDPNTEAAKNVTAHFKSAFTQQVSVVVFTAPEQCERDSERLLPNRATEKECNVITDEVYIRAMEEMGQFIHRDAPDLKYSITAASFFDLVNWTISGGYENNPEPVGSFRLPGRSLAGERRYQAVHEVVFAAGPVRESLVAPMGAKEDMYTNLFFVAPDSELELREIGDKAIRALHNYTAFANTPYAQGGSLFKVFSGANAPTFNVDLPVGDAHASELTREDFEVLVPLIAGFITITLFVAFRNIRAVLIAGGALGLAFVWTMGLMGWAGIALSAVNLAIMPLILGVGIDYSIHIVTEYAEHKRHGMTDPEAFRVAGARSGIALLIGTLTTIAGLTMMMISPSLMMAQLGGVAAFAMVSVFVLVLTFIPAAITVTPGTEKMGRDFVPSTAVPRVARWVTRHRAAVGLFVVALTAATALSSLALEREEFGEPAKNFPEDDGFRIDHERNIRNFYALEPGEAERKTNILVFQGKITEPQVHRYMNAIQAQMAEKGTLDLATSRNLPFLIDVWLTVRNGTTGAGLAILLEELESGGAREADQYPRTAARVERLLDEIFSSPLATFASLFVNYPQNDISIMTFATDTGDFDVAKAGWEDVQASIDEAGAPPRARDGTPMVQRPNFVGNTALNYLFITEELPWLGYLGIAATIAVVLLVLVFTGSLRATAAVASLIVITSVWWLGILPLLDIGLAITLVLPLAFISAIGSDYAVHLAHNMMKVRDAQAVYETVGKAIFFSAVTTLGPFLIFTQTQNVAVSKTMVATAVAVAIILISTLLIIPLYYPLREREPLPEPAEAPAVLPTAPSRVRVVDATRVAEEP